MYPNSDFDEMFNKLFGSGKGSPYTFYHKTFVVDKPKKNSSEDNEDNDYETNTTKDGKYYHFDVPGHNKETLDVSVEDTYLILSGSRTYKTDSGEIEKKLDRKINLKTYCNPNTIEATIKDGVLTVFIPELQKTNAKRNKISVG